MWFYCCFAFLIKFVGGQKAGKLVPVFLSVGVALTILFYNYSGWFLPNFLFFPLTLEFCAGCLLYHTRNQINIYALSFMCLAAPVFLWLANQSESLNVVGNIINNPAMALQRALVWGGFAVCVVGVVTQIDLKYSVKWPQFLLLLGNASYSIYLLPTFIVSLWQIFYRNILSHVPVFEHLTIPPPLCGLIYVAVTIIGGILTWKYFEVPINLKVKQLLFRIGSKNQLEII
jgi:peptidoglycan/LPS O-acetylase OafA/YrhL